LRLSEVKKAYYEGSSERKSLAAIGRIEVSNNDQSIGAELKARLAAAKEGKILECNCNKTDNPFNKQAPRMQTFRGVSSGRNQHCLKARGLI
jgi:hypothetical protein